MAKIREMGLSRGIISEEVTDAKKISELIFHSGFSTASGVSEISGRGVGMDAIRSFLKKSDSHIDIEFRGASGDSGFQPVAFVLRLNRRYWS